MVLSFLSLALTAYAATCSLTSINNRAFAVGCGAASTLAGGASCKLSCLKMYKPTVTTLTCSSGGVLTPSTGFQCIPITQPQFPWKSTQCTSGLSTGSFLGYTYSLVSSVATLVSSDEYKLTSSTAMSLDKGMAVFGPMRTRGGRQAVEVDFSFEILNPTSASAPYSMGDGIWVMLTTTVPSTSALTKPALSDSTNGIVALEFDLFYDSGTDNAAFQGPHVAVLVASSAGALTEVHTATNNLVQSFAPVVSTFKSASLLLQPVVGSATQVIVTVWYDGMTYLRDTLSATSTPAATTPLLNLFTTRQQIYAVAYSYQRGTTSGVGVSEKHVKGMQVCGVERPQYWSRLYVPAGSRVRTCAQVTSFGNPDPAHVGVWKPFACPAAVTRAAPLAPLNIPAPPVSLG